MSSPAAGDSVAAVSAAVEDLDSLPSVRVLLPLAVPAAAGAAVRLVWLAAV